MYITLLQNIIEPHLCGTLECSKMISTQSNLLSIANQRHGHAVLMN